MSTAALSTPSSIFELDWVQVAAGQISLEVWVKRLSEDTRGVIDAAIKITLDPNDAVLAAGPTNYTLPAGWTGLVGGASTIIAVLFNSTESPSGSGQQIYVDPLFETSGEHSGKQKLVSVTLDLKPLVTSLSPIQVVVETFTDSLGFTYSRPAGGNPPAVLDSLVIDLSNDLSNLVVVKGTSGDDTSLDAVVDMRAAVFGEAGNDTAVNLSAGDVFIGGAGFDVARLPGMQSSYSVQFASSHLQESVALAIAGAVAEEGGQPYPAVGLEPGTPLFAITANGSPASLPILIQAEALQFGASTSSVNPLGLLNTGTPIKIVGGADDQVFSSIRLALESASAGDTIVVSPNHVEQFGGPIDVTVDDVRVLLLNSEAPAVVFQLVESESVIRFTLLGNGKADVLGNSGNNVLIGNGAGNVIHGHGGNDTLLGGSGDDALYGGAGSDWLDGGDGWDTATGGSGNDILLADQGGYSLESQQVSAAGQADVLLGGSGSDLLIAAGSFEPSSVRMMGGSGADVFRLLTLEGVDGTANSEAQHFRAHIADLGMNDGLDLSAFAGGSVTQPSYSAFTLDGRIAPVPPVLLTEAPTGDLRLALDDLVLGGVQGPADSAQQRTPAPFVPVASGSEVKLSMVASESELLAATQRASGAQSSQALVDALAPIYFAHELLISQMVLDLTSTS
jgi:Ca2+-binding RTX toxin-like protein